MEAWQQQSPVSLGYFAHERTPDQRAHQGIHSSTDAKHEGGEWNPSLVHSGGSVILFLGEIYTFNSFFFPFSTPTDAYTLWSSVTSLHSHLLRISASEVAGLALRPILLPVTL